MDQGGLLIDDCLEFAKTHSATNPNAALFILLPIQYGQVDSKSVTKYRRLLEDKLFSTFGF